MSAISSQQSSSHVQLPRRCGSGQHTRRDTLPQALRVQTTPYARKVPKKFASVHKKSDFEAATATGVTWKRMEPTLSGNASLGAENFDFSLHGTVKQVTREANAQSR